MGSYLLLTAKDPPRWEGQEEEEGAGEQKVEEEVKIGIGPEDGTEHADAEMSSI